MNERERLIAIIEQAQREAKNTAGSMNGGPAAWYADKLIEAGVVLQKETPKSPNNTTIIANVDEMLAEYLRKRLKIVLDSIDVAPVVWCKDCKHYTDFDAHNCKRLDFHFCNKFGNVTREMDFCSYGERKQK